MTSQGSQLHKLWHHYSWVACRVNKFLSLEDSWWIMQLCCSSWWTSVSAVCVVFNHIRFSRFQWGMSDWTEAFCDSQVQQSIANMHVHKTPGVLALVIRTTMVLPGQSESSGPTHHVTEEMVILVDDKGLEATVLTDSSKFSLQCHTQSDMSWCIMVHDRIVPVGRQLNVSYKTRTQHVEALYCN